VEKQDVLAALAALAQETRLDVYRMLVRAAPDGATPGEIADELGIPAATLSFHLKELRNAQLVDMERDGRLLRYRPDLQKMRDVLAYLTENCCQRLGKGRGRC
jgi:DNA-binding transcriptional ArsR family regulator